MSPFTFRRQAARVARLNRQRHVLLLPACDPADRSKPRWWGLDELLASPDRVLPHRLREFRPALVAGELPDEPHDITSARGWS